MLVILLTVLLDAVGIGLIMPILPALLRSLGGLDAGSVHYGALLAAYALMQFLFSPILGALSDRFGRRPVLLISLAGAAADYLLMAFAPTLAWLYLGRLLAGITGANMAVATAYVTDITPAGQRARRFGLVGAAFRPGGRGVRRRLYRRAAARRIAGRMASACALPGGGDDEYPQPGDGVFPAARIA